jgi:hypothetical protein
VSDRELLTECLEALTHDAAQRTFAGGVRMSQLAIKLRAALAAPEPEPVAWIWQIPLYTAPPAAAPSEDIEALRRENERLRGLLTNASKAVWMNYDGDLLDRIEAALKEVPR